MNGFRLYIPTYYKLKEGQTLLDVAQTFSLPISLLVQENGLLGEPASGEILKIPCVRGNLYTVQASDTKSLLAGNAENYRKKNGTDVCFPGMKVLL